MSRPVSSRIGAVIGGLGFIGFAGLYTVYFSASMGLLFAGIVLGKPLIQDELGLLAKFFVGGSVVVGVISVGSLFVVVGSILGMLLGTLFKSVRFERRGDDEPLIVVERE